MNRCDCCGKFGELETVTLEIKKHKECDVNVLFGKPSEPKAPLNLPREELPPAQLVKPNPVAPYMADELGKMIIK